MFNPFKKKPDFEELAGFTKPTINSSEKDFIEFVDNWIELCASDKTELAFSLLDKSKNKKSHRMTVEDFEFVRFNHFDDDKLPTVTSSKTVKGNLRKDIVKYDDNSGWNLEYDLPLNGIVSDFTLMFDFIIDGKKLLVILEDCHVM